MRYVIIGNGIAGISAAESIRQLDREGRITMIADEAFPPYCRPMISLVLEGVVHPDRLPIRGANFYRELDIEPVLGQRVTAVDCDQKRVSLGDGKAFPFDRLLVATGADPRPIKASGLHLKNIFYMRNEAQVRQMVEALPDARKALVLGGGLVGFKAAYGMLHRGLDVTMLIRSGYPLSMQVDEEAGYMILKELVDRGLKVRVEAEVVAFDGRRKVEEAHLSDGTDIPCDMVVIGKGVLPALAFIPRDRIEVDLGIVVNTTMETSFSDIFAAGDVAELVDIARQTRWVNAIWPEAAAQGRIAGMNMAGRAVAYKGSLSRNVMRIFGLDVMTAGLVNPTDDHCEILRCSDPRRKTYRKLVFRDDRLVGMALVNDIEQGGVLTALIQSEMPVTLPRRALLGASFNYRQLIG